MTGETPVFLFRQRCDRVLFSVSLLEGGVVLRQLEVVCVVAFRVAVQKVAFAQFQRFIPSVQTLELAKICGAPVAVAGLADYLSAAGILRNAGKSRTALRC